jgi:hypothetical protein
LEDVAMIVEPIVKSSQPAWRKQIDRQSKPVSASAPIASFNQTDDDIDTDPAPPMPLWPRVFPGL